MKFLARLLLHFHRLVFGQSHIQRVDLETYDPKSGADEPPTRRPQKEPVAKSGSNTASLNGRTSETNSIAPLPADPVSLQSDHADSQHAPGAFRGDEKSKSAWEIDTATGASKSTAEHGERRSADTQSTTPARISSLETLSSAAHGMAKGRSFNDVQPIFSRPVLPQPTASRHGDELAATLHRLNETVSEHARNHVTRQELRRELESLRRLMETKK